MDTKILKKKGKMSIIIGMALLLIIITMFLFAITKNDGTAFVKGQKEGIRIEKNYLMNVFTWSGLLGNTIIIY